MRTIRSAFSLLAVCLLLPDPETGGNGSANASPPAPQTPLDKIRAEGKVLADDLQREFTELHKKLNGGQTTHAARVQTHITGLRQLLGSLPPQNFMAEQEARRKDVADNGGAGTSPAWLVEVDKLRKEGKHEEALKLIPDNKVEAANATSPGSAPASTESPTPGAPVPADPNDSAASADKPGETKTETKVEA